MSIWVDKTFTFHCSSEKLNYKTSLFMKVEQLCQYINKIIATWQY